jgi:hypothetical protein
VAHPVSSGSILVCGQVRMLTSNYASTPRALADPHPVLGHLGLGQRRQVGDVGQSHLLFRQLTPTPGAALQGHRYIYGGLSDLFRAGRLPEGEGPLAGLAAGAFGLAHPSTFGKGGCLALGSSFQFCIFGLQRLVAGSQLGDLALQLANLLLQLGYQSQQLLPAQRGSIFRQHHGLKYKLPRLKPQARVANQILWTQPV